ncbi:MAG: AMP-binding protein [Streptosporangiales bacterium]|nr:AMP-binding protein [Streptosporangiales bacterium]
MRGSTLVRLLDERADRDGAAPALMTAEEVVSYRQLRDRAASVAEGLVEAGIGPGDRVALWLPNCAEYVETCFALARLGAIAVALNTRFRAHEAQDILSRSGARALVLCPEVKNVDFLSMVAGLDRRALPALDTLILVGSSARPPEAPADLRTVPFDALRRAGTRRGAPAPAADLRVTGDSPCNVFTSSGTTSAPKLVLLDQAALATHARHVASAFGYGAPDCRVLCMLPLCGVFGFDTLLGTLAGGAAAVLMPVFDGDEAARLIERHRVTHTNGADEMLRRILAASDPQRLGSLREAAFANFSGDPRALVDAGDRLGAHFFQTYGSSEVQALMCYQAPGTGAERRALGGGVPVADEIEVRVRDPETDRLLGPGESGQLEIRGPNILAGYLGDERARRRTLTEDGFVRSGDLGYLEGGGKGFVYLARLGDALRLGGFLVHPREIEEFLEGLPGVGGAQVVGVSLPTGTVPVGFVVGDGSARLDEEDLIARCRTRLAAFKVPRRIVRLSAFPTVGSANGVKIRRVELRDRAAELLREAP